MKGLRQVYFYFLMVIVSLFGVTGCWDNHELNDVAFIIGTGLDKIGKDSFLASVQIADPTEQQGGSGGKASEAKGYKVESAEGRDLSDALQNLQNHLSRRLITGHRQAIVISDELARQGIGAYLDEFVRNPENSLRTDLFIIKGDTAKKFLQSSYAFETFSALAAGNEQKLLSTSQTTLRDFLYDAMGDAQSGTLPVIDTSAQETKSHDGQEQNTTPSFSLDSTALFNRKLQSIGYLNGEQSFFYLWGVNRLQHLTLSVPIDSSGNLISLAMTHLHSKFRIVSQAGQQVAQVTLSGTGRIIENHSTFSPSKLSDIVSIQHKLNQHVSTRMRQLMTQTQQRYQTDIFHFGELIHQNDPSTWQHMKTNWPQEFPKLKIEVSANLTVLHGGEMKTNDVFAG